MSESLLQEECDRNLEKLGLKVPVAPVMPSVIAPVEPAPLEVPELAIAVVESTKQNEVLQPIGPTPYDGMKIVIGHGVPVIPLRPRQKIAFLNDWQDRATTDEGQTTAWAAENPDCNWACVALAVPDGAWFLEIDRSDVVQQIELETGHKMPRTFRVRSSPGRGHFYFKHSAASIAMGNLQAVDDKGRESWSARCDRRYIVAPWSWHPTTNAQYYLMRDVPLVEAPGWLIAWLLKNKTEKTTVSATDEGGPIIEGNRNNALASIAGKMRDAGMLHEEIESVLLRINEQRCTPNLDEEEVKTIADSISRYKIPAAPGKLIIGSKLEMPATKVELPPDPNSEESIPEFDPSVVNGIYRRIVELVTRGTTMQPQFAYAVAKTIIGARMAGRVKFENLDIEPRFYTALIGATGSGKGEAYRRCVKILRPEGSVMAAEDPRGCGIKILNSSDSGAGLKDFFFEPPDKQPVLVYIDEVRSLGNKSKDTRNPDILDTIGELADSTSITRNLAKRSGGTKSKDDARLSVVMCGQDGQTYMSSFTGRTGIGLYDRLYPEFGVPQETGNMPPILGSEAFDVLQEINRLFEGGTGVMTMTADAEAYLDDFWKSQPAEVRKKARWRKNLFLDSYMSAFGCDRELVNLEDARIAVKIFIRQLAIRRVCFREEVPDKIGHYTAMIKQITERMTDLLKAGVPPAQVARSRRDFETQTNSYRNNEGVFFARAWATFQPVWLESVKVKAGNGQEYSKYLPVAEEE